jgi:hypothetical protein
MLPPPKTEIPLEGSYQYFEGDRHFADENFKLVYFPNVQNYHMYAEILSRQETGEFLKIFTRLEMNHNFVPHFARIEKSLGNKYALETYTADHAKSELQYTFQTPQDTQEFKRALTPRHFLTTPAICNTAIFTLSKRFDLNEKKPITLVTSENEWSYSSPPSEKTIYGEFKTKDFKDFQIQGKTFSASHFCLYESNSLNNSADAVELFLSKHYNVPYQLSHGNLRMTINSLKRN